MDTRGLTPERVLRHLRQIDLRVVLILLITAVAIVACMSRRQG